MEWIETTGVSLDEAKERALDRLGVAEDELEVEVLSEPTRSMFGLRKSEARLRARVRPTSPRPRVDRRDRNRRSDRNGGRGRQAGGRQDQKGGRGTQDSRQGGSGDVGKGGGNRRRRGNGGGRQADRQQDQVTASAGHDGDDGRTSGSPDKGREKGRQSAAVESSAKSANGNGRRSDRERAEVEAMDLQTQAGITEGFVQGLLDAMGLDARVESTIEEDRLTVEAHGLNLGLAIGQRGETVRAITELSRTLVQRSSDGQAEGFLVVDIGGYRERRRSFLADFARVQAEAVLEDGRSRAMEPMSAADRKVIHDTVGEIDGLATISEGSDADRRMVIMVESTG